MDDNLFIYDEHKRRHDKRRIHKKENRDGLSTSEQNVLTNENDETFIVVFGDAFICVRFAVKLDCKAHLLLTFLN